MERRASAAQTPERPLVAVALALLAGAWLGRSLAPPREVLALALAAAAGAWCAARVLEVHAGPSRRPGWTTLALLAVLAALGGLPRSQPPRGKREGSWEPERSTARGELGRVTHPSREPSWLEMPAGVAARGEWISVEPIDAPSREARGPVPPPRALGDPGERLVWNVRADEVVRRGRAPPWEEWTEWIGEARAECVRRCAQFERGASRELARALLCGESAGMSQELTQLFTRTGLRHVLAVSGSHVTLLAGTLLAPLLARARGGRSFVPAVLLAAAAAALAAMTGSQAPVRRAAIALAASAFAPRVAGVRRVDTLSLLALGLVLEATFDVRIVFSVSLLLSYVATASLLLGARCIAEAIVFPIPSRTLGPTTLGRATMTVTTRWTRFALAASIAAVTWTLPLIWITFGEWSPIGVLLTIVTTPLFAWELVVGWLVLLVPGSGLAALFDAPAHALVELLKASDACAGTPHVLPVRPAEFVLAAGALLVFATASRRAICGLSPRWIGAAACASWAALLAPWAARPRALVVDVLDVGHGTCVVARGPGGPAWIFDAGSRDRTRVGPGALGPLLADCEAGEVVVVLSHDDSDHAAGLEWLVERYPVRFWAGALPAPVGERLPHTAGRADSRGAGDELILERLGPERAVLSRGTTEEGNEGSRTLFLTWAGTAIALHGDALEAGLERQLRSHARNGPFQALLWPHHGDDTAWMARLIAEQPATEVWISGSGPARAEIELGRRGIPVRATARSGPLHFDFEPP